MEGTFQPGFTSRLPRHSADFSELSKPELKRKRKLDTSSEAWAGETRAVVEDYGSWNDGWKNASVEDKEGRSERVDIVASRMNGLETV
ncbi:hypothetical protein RRG08_014139 [Elysia crispata]|uniref:Uncharacterized protein n=1 Tax=Elysia crispata TaxID=231223 RepID=A0AAE1AH31_9GAST|nr:hypothetical protein RRG08_014139 [Elysia crispata]